MILQFLNELSVWSGEDGGGAWRVKVTDMVGVKWMVKHPRADAREVGV